MKVAVMGAGAVGCFYGGMLARAGHAVTLIGRAQHVEAVRRDGLLLDTQSFRESVAIDASTEPAAVRDAKLVLCCVKSSDTEAAAAQMAPHLERDALVLSLQNGVDNAERLQALLPQRVVAAAVYVACEIAGPGHLKHHGRGEVVVGPTGQDDALVALFASAGVPVRVSDNVVGALWAKLAINCAYNGLSAISQQPYGRLVQFEGVQTVMRDIVDECLAVARAAGVDVPGDVWAAACDIARSMAGQLSSTAHDLARGRRGEIDHLNGTVVRRGEALGVATPVNRALHTVVRLLEERAEAR